MGATLIGSVNVGLVIGVGGVIMTLGLIGTGTAGIYYISFPGVGLTTFGLDTSGIAPWLPWADNKATRPTISPIKANKPNKPNKRGVQQVFFSRVGGIIGGSDTLG